jgi:hypothetical protein
VFFKEDFPRLVLLKTRPETPPPRALTPVRGGGISGLYKQGGFAAFFYTDTKSKKNHIPLNKI